MYKITKQDLINGFDYYKSEQIDPAKKNSLFLAGVYSILSIIDKYTNQKNIFLELVSKDLVSPQDFLNNKKKLNSVLKGKSLANKREKNLLNFAEFWKDSLLEEKILADASNGRAREFELRNELAENAPGIGYKCSSLLFMKSGYKNIVPVDRWTQRFLATKQKENDDFFVDLRTGVGNAGTNTPYEGLKKKEFLFFEKKFSSFARRKKVSPTIYHCALWYKVSSSNK